MNHVVAGAGVVVIVAKVSESARPPEPIPGVPPPQLSRLPARTPLQRFALATVPESLAHEIARVPNPLPRCCAFNNFRCGNKLKYRIDEGWACAKHFELFWEDHEIGDHRVVRVRDY